MFALPRKQGKLDTGLIGRGLEGFQNRAAVELQPGEDWVSRLRNVINESRLCLVLVSEKASAHSPWVSKEWTLIQDTVWRRPDLSVCPVILDDADIPTFLRPWQLLRASRENARLERAADGVAEMLEVTGHRFMLAAQCHPEELYTTEQPWAQFFQAFIDACAERAQKGHREVEEVFNFSLPIKASA